MNEYEQIYQNPSKPDFKKQELQQESLFTLAISKLQEYRLIEWTIKDKPNSPKQKFKLTKRGLAFYLLVRNK